MALVVSRIHETERKNYDERLLRLPEISMILSVLFSGTVLFQSIGLNDIFTFQLGGCDNESEKVYHLIG